MVHVGQLATHSAASARHGTDPRVSSGYNFHMCLQLEPDELKLGALPLVLSVRDIGNTALGTPHTHLGTIYEPDETETLADSVQNMESVEVRITDARLAWNALKNRAKIA